MPDRLMARERVPVAHGAMARSHADTAIVPAGSSTVVARRDAGVWRLARRPRRPSGAALAFVAVVLVPTLVTAGYTLAWASYRYVSEFRVTVRSVEPIKAGGIAELFGIGGMSQTGNDSNAVVQYLKSRDAIENIRNTLPIDGMFAAPSIDWLSRLSGSAEIEKVTRYWDRMVDASYEASTGTILVRVTAFSPQNAYDLARGLLANAEALVNRMSTRARQDAVAFAEQAVTKAEARLATVRRDTRALQDKERTLDPAKAADATLLLAGKLQEEIARRGADLATLKGRLSDAAPTVRITEESIAGLRKELAAVEARATAPPVVSGAGDPDDPRTLSSIMGAFQQNADERGFAEKAYLSALTSLETARMDANRQQVYLATIVPPGLPQEPSFPKPLTQIVTTFAIATALWLIGRLTVLSIREHM